MGSVYTDPILVCVDPNCGRIGITLHPIVRELQAILGERSNWDSIGNSLPTSLERAIEYIDIDEYVEANPKSLRLRKCILRATTRKRAANLNYTICA